MRPVLLLVTIGVTVLGCDGAPPDSDAGRDAALAPDGDVLDGGPLDAGTPPPRDAGNDAGSTTDAGSMDPSRPSMGSGGTFPGEQSRTAGGVPYTIYLPGSYDPSRPVPLLSLFHGQGDTGANMVRFWRDLAEAEGFALLATTATGSSGGWVPGTDIGRYDGALTDALAAYNIEQSRHYIWGFSAGAHVVHAVALMNAGTFAAYSVSAGVLDALAGSTAPAAASRRIPVDIHIGESDPLFPGATADRTRFLTAGWSEGTDFRLSSFAGGHVVRPEHRGEVWAFLEPWVHPPD